MEGLKSNKKFCLEGYKAIGEPLGEGTYGIVFQALEENTNNKVAIKKMHISYDDDGIPSTSLREIAVLKRLKHKNLVKFLGVSYKPSELYAIFERYEIDLKEKISETSEFSLDNIKRYMKDILSGINYLHSRRFFHRDLKPANILIDKNDTLKIADFGLIRNFEVPTAPLTHEVVTLWYRPPEILIQEEGTYDLGTDIWSIGCIFGELFMLEPMFAGRSDISQLLGIFQILGTPNDEVWPGFSESHKYACKFPLFRPVNLAETFPRMGDDGRDLLKKMLNYSVKERITALSALYHPFLHSPDNNSTN